MKHFHFVLTCFFFLIISFVSAQNNYKILNKYNLAGNGGNTCIATDDATDRVFVSRGTTVQIIDMKDGKNIANIEGLKGARGITFCENMNSGYIVNGLDSSFVAFDLKTNLKTGIFPCQGRNPDAILFDFNTQRLFVLNTGSNSICVFDVSVGKFISKILLDGEPSSIVNDDNGNIYVTLKDLAMICNINALTMKVVKRWKLGEGKSPTSLGIDKATHQLFSVCENKLMVISDAEKGFVTSKVAIGANAGGVVFDPELKRVYSANNDGTLTVVQQTDNTTYKVTENVKTMRGAGKIALNSKTHHLFVSAADNGEKSTSVTILEIAP